MKNYSVDLREHEFEAVVEILEYASLKLDEKRKATLDALIHRVKATPAQDNPIVFGYEDLTSVVSNAIKFVVDMPATLKLSNKNLEQQEISKIALANSLFMWLNRENNLKRVIMLDYTDDTYDFESNDDLI